MLCIYKKSGMSMNVYVPVHVCACVYVYECICVCQYVCACVYVYVNMCVHACMCMCLCVCMCACVCMCIECFSVHACRCINRIITATIFQCNRSAMSGNLVQLTSTCSCNLIYHYNICYGPEERYHIRV